MPKTKRTENKASEPYYTNSTQLPVGHTDDLFEAVKLQDPLQTKYTGGTVLHGFLGERISGKNAKLIIKKVFEKYKLPYLSITPTFSICQEHGYLEGEHWTCPVEGCELSPEVYSRVVGYIRPVQQWNKGKVQEYKERKVFQVKEDERD